MQVKYARALIHRDMAEEIPVTVFEHEIGILKDIHGDANVTVVDGDFGAAEIDAGEEYDRLMNCYGRNDAGQPFVERIIGIGADSLEAFGTDEAPKKKAGRSKKAEADSE